MSLPNTIEDAIFRHLGIGQCDRYEQLLWRTGAACCCIELYEQVFTHRSVLLFGKGGMPITNECRDNLGYVMADAMGFDLFACGCFGG